MRRIALPFAATALCALALGAATASAAPPVISDTAFSHLGTEAVTLEATLDPQGKATKYHFEYGPGACSAEPDPCVALPEAQLTAKSPATTVSAELGGLSPATTYHFRLIATHAGEPGGEVQGPDTAFTTYRPPPLFGPCPANESLRAAQPSAALPDCRAYEQASPVAKNGLDARGRVSFVKAAADGRRVSFTTTNGIPGGAGSQEMPIYLAARAGGNWSTQGLLPPATVGEEAFVMGWNPELSEFFDAARRFSGAGGGTFLARSSEDGSLATIVPYGAGLSAQVPSYVGSSAEGSVVLFESTSKLSSVPAALEGKRNLYLWDRATNTIGLAGVLNDGTAPPAGAIAGPYDWTGKPGPVLAGGAINSYYLQDEHAVTAEGSLFFTAAKTGALYLRRNPTEPQSPLDGQGRCTDPAKACTTEISATHKTNGTGAGPDPAGQRPAAFMQASPDGKSALFTSSEKLTNDANTGPEVLPPALARANLPVPGGTGTDLGFLPAHGKGVAVDANHIYWANPGKGKPGEGTIERANLDGTEVKDEFITGADNPQYVTLAGEFIYWTNAGDEQAGTGTIGRAKLGAGGAEGINQAFITGANDPQGVAVGGEFIYWANAGAKHGNGEAEDASRAIGRAKLAGGEAQEVDQAFIAVGGGGLENRPQGIALDASHIYMGINASQGFNSFVFRYDIGGDPASWVFLFDGQQTDVKGIALDAGHVYWARQGADAIGRANLDLTSPELEFVKEAGSPLGLALNAEHLYWSANQESPPNPGNDLYRWQAGSGGAEDELTDLTPDPGDVAAGTDVLGVLGASADNSYVYFAANGDLDGAGPATAGDCEGTVESASLGFKGHCSLYLAHPGDPIAYLARLNAGGETSDAFNWLPHGGVGAQLGKTARVSPDGRTLLFQSQEKLSAYENKGTSELYRYRVGDPAGVTCVSCNPTGAPPTQIAPSFGSITLSTIFPGETSFTLSRNLSADGNRVFFETTDALVVEDTNGAGGCPIVGPEQGNYSICLDVYEWEAEGTGSCKEDEQGGGCLYLLSTGKSSDAAYLADASASGDDAFLITRSPLVGQDQDQLYDVYDAHLGGGLAAQNQLAPVPCEGEACKPAVPPAPATAPCGSACFAGPGSPAPKREHRNKHHKKKHHKKHKRQANAETTRRSSR